MSVSLLETTWRSCSAHCCYASPKAIIFRSIYWTPPATALQRHLILPIWGYRIMRESGYSVPTSSLHMNRFWYFLTEILTRKQAIKRCFIFPSALQLHWKDGNTKIEIFSLKRCITVLPDINLQSLLDFLNTADSQLKLMLLYQSINQSIYWTKGPIGHLHWHAWIQCRNSLNLRVSVQWVSVLGCWGPQIRRKKVENFKLQQLDCCAHDALVRYLAERQNCPQRRVW